MNVFNQKVTVVNHYIEDGIDKYKKVLLDNCMWKKKISKTVEGNQLNIAEYYSVTILFRDGYGTEWNLNAKNNQDLLILGEFKEEVTAENYPRILKMDNVGIIKSVADNTLQNHLKHWKVICV